ncbi:hypothetical protein CEXT_335631 [Caerostris extrusa]|uniref:Uncharacterized protein n=1 Tax=Caerostris extrusa TaxID=172846 RepID=A0AAV4RFV7_CAEEX|nr:hypothetical protein CEXT_335631 [Caerostris extrusa]
MTLFYLQLQKKIYGVTALLGTKVSIERYRGRNQQEIKRAPATSQPPRTQPSPHRVTEQSYANVVKPTPKGQRPYQAERTNIIPAPTPTNSSAPLTQMPQPFPCITSTYARYQYQLYHPLTGS